MNKVICIRSKQEIGNPPKPLQGARSAPPLKVVGPTHSREPRLTIVEWITGLTAIAVIAVFIALMVMVAMVIFHR